jgi:putative FmdB family regulatory protein
MPFYDYRCKACGHQFEQFHSIGATPKPCPHCESDAVEIIITSSVSVSRGILAHAGDGHRASKEQLEDKWREESPKLRKKLEDKLGRDRVQRDAPSLYAHDDD